ncbi:hypothetical protein M427DRAFT_355440 [Gonapodya prolifera JEL478]|uniref:Uncharacterized protein n=1 Tax=Gonapodya prolifera (strain JEL478) TaxID=1344416 RepID=A0A139ABL2_GONPJ|nr:hypothetical protein M427DRAFT_355440 [Gonapodya prolifera JEL478]|eukprot:KXS14181.1 hypothetical protein M427DRAFT_355440 [Gonapodya prolifera JEL478]
MIRTTRPGSVQPDGLSQPSTPAVEPDEHARRRRLSPAVIDRIRASIGLAVLQPRIISHPLTLKHLSVLRGHLNRVKDTNY